jgi:hypothetical protein
VVSVGNSHCAGQGTIAVRISDRIVASTLGGEEMKQRFKVAATILSLILKTRDLKKRRRVQVGGLSG